MITFDTCPECGSNEAYELPPRWPNLIECSKCGHPRERSSGEDSRAVSGYLNPAGAKALAAKPFRGCFGAVSPKQSILAESELTDCTNPGEPSVPVMCYAAHDRVDLNRSAGSNARGSRPGEGQNDKGGRLDSDNEKLRGG